MVLRIHVNYLVSITLFDFLHEIRELGIALFILDGVHVYQNFYVIINIMRRPRSEVRYDSK